MSENTDCRRNLTVRMLPEIHQRLMTLSSQLGVSASRLVEIAVRHTVDALNEMVHERLLREERREKALAKIDAVGQKRTRFSPPGSPRVSSAESPPDELR